MEAYYVCSPIAWFLKLMYLRFSCEHMLIYVILSDSHVTSLCWVSHDLFNQSSISEHFRLFVVFL